MTNRVFLYIGLLLILIQSTSQRRPKIYGDAIPKHELETHHASTQKKLVLYHNYFRTKVDPPAQDMLHLKWYEEAADAAQSWAEACQLLIHDNVTGRWVPDFGSCGQNIFIANVQVPWFFAIQTWFLEKDNFTYGSNDNDLEVIGHYTQMAWYSTHKVGCGFHYCNVAPRPFYNYVCNYCPIGNHPDRIGRPYTKGAPCGACKGSCRYKKLCVNSCPYADLWVNCKELKASWHDWLCESENNRFCRATCECDETRIF